MELGTAPIQYYPVSNACLEQPLLRLRIPEVKLQLVTRNYRACELALQ